MPQKSLRAVGIRCWSVSEFWSGLGMGSGRGPGRNGGPMMHGPRGSALVAPPLVELKL